MKNIFVAFTAFFLCFGAGVFAQSDAPDVVYLKNGCTIVGTVSGIDAESILHLTTTDGSELTFKLSEIEKMENRTRASAAPQQQAADAASTNTAERSPRDGVRWNIELSQSATDQESTSLFELCGIIGARAYDGRMFVGGGFGLNVFSCYNYDDDDTMLGDALCLPLFVAVNLTPLRESCSPYVDLRYGVSVGDAYGTYASGGIGFSLRFNDVRMMRVGFNYRLQSYEYEYEVSWVGDDSYTKYEWYSDRKIINCFGVKVGLEL